ncbi:MAG: serine/threonine-protein phosphatase [Treponema sp.]|nr:serine/threonine-protein phosphatase [Treponema sp.]
MSKCTVNTLILSLLAAVLFFSCENKRAHRLYIGDTYHYWEATANSKVGDALRNADLFKKLDDASISNLSNVLGKGSHYVWVRAEFELPPQFKGQQLGLVMPQLGFAAQLYCNNMYISKYGEFPPHEKSTLHEVQFYSFPVNVLNQYGKNTILAKVYIQGRGGVSSRAVIMPYRYAYSLYEVLNFYHTRVYIFLVGIQFFAFILYLTFYLKLPRFKEYFDFALINVFTLVFLVQFFATELPVYRNGWIPYLLFIKCTLWVPIYVIGYFTSSFTLHYLRTSLSRPMEIARIAIVAVQVAVTLAMPSYSALTAVVPFMLALSVVQALTSVVPLIRSLSYSHSHKRAIEFSMLFLPQIIAAVIDLLLRLHDNTQVYPICALFGWQLSLLGFLLILISRFSQIYKDNERLTDHLQEEVDHRTQDLYKVNRELAQVNGHLEDEKFRADMDLQMASLVQQRFLPQPNRQFCGWDISVYYSPSAIVSGDLYDYYTEKDMLNGLALFDVSGHGISASLVAMLSKNIISRAFQRGFITDEPVDSILNRINNIILNEKGDIDNYLTGILCRFVTDEKTGTYRVELGNAGHPYPLKFSAQDNEVFELRGNSGKKYYGAIGMDGIDISFAKSDFVMAEGDVLICYTDGLTEAMNTKSEQFGAERVKQLIKENNTLSANDLIKSIIKQHTAFTKGRPVDDDITIVVAKRTNAKDFVSTADDEIQDEGEVIELTPIEEETVNDMGGGIIDLLPVDE